MCGSLARCSTLSMHAHVREHGQGRLRHNLQFTHAQSRSRLGFALFLFQMAQMCLIDHKLGNDQVAKSASDGP